MWHREKPYAELVEAQTLPALPSALFDHLTKPEFAYAHKWRKGDLVMWDNCAVQHKAVFDYEPPLRRVMQRCTIEGTAAF